MVGHCGVGIALHVRNLACRMERTEASHLKTNVLKLRFEHNNCHDLIQLGTVDVATFDLVEKSIRGTEGKRGKTRVIELRGQ